MKDNKLPRAGRALFSDSLATIVGSVFGTTTTTSYIESTSGVAVGARTGFASIVTGCCFLLALFFSPLIACCNKCSYDTSFSGGRCINGCKLC